MIQLRKQYRELFVHGSFKICDFENEAVLSYIKEDRNRRAVVVLNFTDKPQDLNLMLVRDMTVLVSNYSGKSKEPVLKPFEGRIYISTL
ncbi:hypothetical protein V1504DRAFT_435364 [Lipomyces starkeyi]